MKLVLVSLMVSMGLSAQAEDLSLVFYNTPPATQKTDCESVTKLVKRTVVGRSGGMVTFITLSNDIEGICEKAVFPNTRNYVVESEENDGCGSKVYRAEQEGTAETLKLYDHRKRKCMDVVAADFILAQAHPQKRYPLMYASEPTVGRPDIPYHPGPEQDIDGADSIARAIVNNPQIGEALRHSGYTEIVQMTRQGMAPGITRFKIVAVAAGLRGPGRVIVTIVEDMRPTYADGAIKYEVDIQILE